MGLLSRLYLLTMILIEDLGEHILLEFSARMTSTESVNETGWSGNEIKSICDSLKTLIAASGDTETLAEVNDLCSIHSILRCYETGT